MVWAALLARPRPELINARPAHASGATSRAPMQSVVCVSESPGGRIKSVSLFPDIFRPSVFLSHAIWFGCDVGTDNQHQTKRLNAETRRHKSAARRWLREQSQRREYQKPACQQQYKTRRFERIKPRGRLRHKGQNTTTGHGNVAFVMVKTGEYACRPFVSAYIQNIDGRHKKNEFHFRRDTLAG